MIRSRLDDGVKVHACPVTTYQTRGLEEHFDAEKGKDIRKSLQ